MMKPSSNGRGTITKRIEDGVLVKTPKKYPATPTRQPSARRKTSAEIASTVNGFINEARASTKSATIKNERADPTKMNQKVTTDRARISNNEIIQKLMQGQKLPVKLAHTPNAVGPSKNAPPMTTISFGKNALKVAEKPMSKSQLRPTPEHAQSSMKQTNRNKSNVSNMSAGKSPSTVLAKRADGTSVRRASGSAAIIQEDQIGNGNQATRPKNKLPIQKMRSEKPAATSYTPNFYLTSSSSEDEELGGPSRDGGCQVPTSPASKAKMWNEINKSTGPGFPAWKFRPPAQGRQMSQVGAEEFAETFKNLGIEAERASKKVQAEEPRQNKFSNYMRKMKSASKSRDADTSTAGLEDNNNLKKMYSDQLDAMREKALASIKAMDTQARGSDGEMSLEVVKDGVSKTYRGMSSTDMLKNAVESLQQHRKESFNFQKPESGTYLDRKSGYEFAQGDHLHREGSNREKSAAARNKNTMGGLGGSAGERVRIIKGDQVRAMKKDVNVSRDTQSQDLIRMKAIKDNPLQKLKKISETLKMERANALSRRASVNYFSSSESDYEPDGFRKEIK